MPLFSFFGQKRVPKEFLCSLSTAQVPMADPVMYQGSTFERKNIVAQLGRGNHSDLVPNKRLKIEIEKWKKANNYQPSTNEGPLKNEYNHLFSMIILGDSGVGKSCLLLRYADGTYTESYISTIGVDFKIKTAEVDDEIVRLQIWDVAHYERFETMYDLHRFLGIIIAFDLTDEKSFNNVKKWIDFAIRCDRKHIVLVGTKSDLITKRVIDHARAKKYADDLEILYIETSAKEDTNVTELFECLVRKITNIFKNNSIAYESRSIQKFKIAYQKECDKEWITNPFSFMKRKLRKSDSDQDAMKSLQEAMDHAKADPTSRTARALTAMKIEFR